MRIYVDMDDTICDFTGAKEAALSKHPEQAYPWAEYGFFVNLEPIEGAIEALKTLSKKHDVWILTRPSVLNPHSYTEKRVWVEKHLGIGWCEKLILCPDKSLLKGDLLIDDNPWEKFEGASILFGHGMINWNHCLTIIQMADELNREVGDLIKENKVAILRKLRTEGEEYLQELYKNLPDFLKDNDEA